MLEKLISRNVANLQRLYSPKQFLDVNFESSVCPPVLQFIGRWVHQFDVADDSRQGRLIGRLCAIDGMHFDQSEQIIKFRKMIRQD